MATGTIKQPESYAGFEIVTHTVVSDRSIAANEVTGNISATFTKAGYYPLGVVGTSRTGTGSTFGNVVGLHMTAQSEGSVTLRTNIRNISTTSAITAITIYADVLWMKIK